MLIDPGTTLGISSTKTQPYYDTISKLLVSTRGLVFEWLGLFGILDTLKKKIVFALTMR